MQALVSNGGGRLCVHQKGETEGFMKLLVDAKSKRILGASFLGTSGDEAIHCVLNVQDVRQGALCHWCADGLRVHLQDHAGLRR